jgi:hypothetical protein
VLNVDVMRLRTFLTEKEKPVPMDAQHLRHRTRMRIENVETIVPYLAPHFEGDALGPKNVDWTIKNCARSHCPKPGSSTSAGNGTNGIKITITITIRIKKKRKARLVVTLFPGVIRGGGERVQNPFPPHAHTDSEHLDAARDPISRPKMGCKPGIPGSF